MYSHILFYTFHINKKNQEPRQSYSTPNGKGTQTIKTGTQAESQEANSFLRDDHQTIINRMHRKSETNRKQCHGNEGQNVLRNSKAEAYFTDLF